MNFSIGTRVRALSDSNYGRPLSGALAWEPMSDMCNVWVVSAIVPPGTLGTVVDHCSSMDAKDACVVKWDEEAWEGVTKVCGSNPNFVACSALEDAEPSFMKRLARILRAFFVKWAWR